MVHLGPLPGSPRFGGSFEQVVSGAVRDAEILAEAGFPAVLVENFGDSPYYPDRVPPVTVAAMTAVAVEIRNRTGVELGINVLRNDAEAALGVAVAVGAAFVRVNVLTGVMFTDQGIIQGSAHEVLRARARLGARVGILADVHVKHAVPPPGLTLEQAAADTWTRGGADALVVSGDATGRPVTPEALRTVRTVCPDAPLVVGSGISPENLSAFSGLADSVIVGTWLKHDGRVDAPVDPGRARLLVAAAAEAGLL
ncbi:MAG: hypothetical protein KatS3mg011_1388 [Acidimicrobiia bacterium]|nr:MAG: hypothetical protein KatS3mg011_1388 [Acidimicrobiia bacterium]